ncbi:hypothetical protein [Roseicyclus sp.]|uniref:hypothetical protein n=1 Tax=Roseicyclus sp. TaxID=1914329 RepID=UPI003F6D69EE
MNMTVAPLLAPFLALSLAACGVVDRTADAPLTIETPPAGGPTTVDTATDQSLSSAEVPIAEQPQAEGRFLGFSVTSLGDATIPGLWLETPLVNAPMTGRIVAENGRQIAVELRPTGGARGSGSRLSLAGFTALGLQLTALSTLTVIGDA